MDSFFIGNKNIGKLSQPYIIAEAGINHNGDIDLAKKMILAAKETKADAVKFQTFSAKEFVQDRSVMYTYRSQGKKVTEPIYDIFERAEFDEEQWRELKSFCDDVGIEFLSTAGNVSDFELLRNLGVRAVKVGSDDFVNIPLIRYYAGAGIPLLLSCGMATESEIELTLQTAGIGTKKNIALFLCTSEYPTPPEDVNILRLVSLRRKYPKLILGLSDHTMGSVAATMAVACGATIFEKHFTLDHDLPGPDHWFAETPKTLAKWVEDIKEASLMLGNGELAPTENEIKNRAEYHRSITTLSEIKKGELLSEHNLCMRRPGTGMPACMWDDIVGRRAARDIGINIQLCAEDIEN